MLHLSPAETTQETSSMSLSNMSDHFPIHEGTLLASRYQVQAFLGEGSFGKVAECADIVTDTQVAIKITKNDPFFIERALEEIKILKQLQTLDPDRCNLVRWSGSFVHERFICLEFELLDLSLGDYMVQRHYWPLSIGEIRPVIHQLTTALLHLEALEIIHADVKPDNIMVVDRRQQPLWVKLIDFGLALHVTDSVQGSCVQSLWYRAPEVMLGLVFMEPIDMWSLGLVAAELALGHSLFPAEHEYDMMKFIVDALGQPPDYQLNCGHRSTHFFKAEGSFNQQTWRLKSPEEFARRTGHHFNDTRYFHISSLDALEEMIYFRNKAEKKELRNFVDLLKKMLLVDKNGRIIPLKVLEHPFFAVEQHADSIVNMKNPAVTQQPSSLEKSDHSYKLCNAPSEAATPHEEAESVSSKLEEDKEAHVQPVDIEEASSMRADCVNMFFEDITKALSSCFYSHSHTS